MVNKRLRKFVSKNIPIMKSYLSIIFPTTDNDFQVLHSLEDVEVEL